MKPCLQCNSPHSNEKFCSGSCSAAYHNGKIPKRKKEGNCLLCKAICSKTRAYCSIPCYKQAVQLRSSGKPPRDRKKENLKAVKSHIKKLKLKALEHKGGKCLICSYDKCNRNMHFHHIDPSKKDFTISGRSISWERVKVELDKCILLCCRCHGEVHDELITLDPSGLTWTYKEGTIGLSGIEPKSCVYQTLAGV